MDSPNDIAMVPPPKRGPPGVGSPRRAPAAPRGRLRGPRRHCRPGAGVCESQKNHGQMLKKKLVGGWATPLKNISQLG